jgi:hypothetical protein
MTAAADQRSDHKHSQSRTNLPAQAFLGLPSQQRSYQVNALRVHSIGKVDLRGQNEPERELPVFGVERRRADDHLVAGGSALKQKEDELLKHITHSKTPRDHQSTALV